MAETPFASLSELKRVETTVKSLANTTKELSDSVNKIGVAQASTNASIQTLATLIEGEISNRRSDSHRLDSSLSSLGEDLKTRPAGISLPQMLFAVIAVIGSIGAIVAIIGSVGALGVWTATNISRNVADELDSKISENVIELQKENKASGEYNKHLDSTIRLFLDEFQRLETKVQAHQVDGHSIKIIDNATEVKQNRDDIVKIRESRFDGDDGLIIQEQIIDLYERLNRLEVKP